MKTKQIILFALFSLISMGVLWAQEQMPYKSKATFKTDTLQYLEYNFNLRSTQYIGKTVGEILRELEYPVLYIVESMHQTMPGLSGLSSKLVGLSLGIMQTDKNPSPLKDYYIFLRFESPPTLDEYKEASGFSNDNPCPLFTQKLYDFIKDLKVSNVTSNPYIIQKRENLKKANTINEIGKDKKD